MDSESYTSLVLDYINAALPRLGHLHFSDRRDGSNDSKHLPIGEGLIDWQHVGGFLREAGYGKRAAIEIRFTDNAAEKTIASACAFYRCRQTDLKDGIEVRGMADMALNSDFVAKLDALPCFVPIPDAVRALLMLPEKAVIEKSDDFVYFVVPSASYADRHADPFDVLYGEALDRFDWADYIFGVRYHGLHLSAVLIDKERRIAVCDTIFNMRPNEKMSWTSFEKTLKTALEYAKTKSPNPRQKTDHVMVTPYGGVQFIDVMEELAWGKDY